MGRTRKRGETKQDDALHGCDAMDVAICKIYEDDPHLGFAAVGEKLDVAPSTIWARVQKKSWAALYASRNPPDSKRVGLALPKAWRVYLKGLNSEDEKLATAIAERLLANQLPVVEGKSTGSLTIVLSEEQRRDVSSLFQRARSGGTRPPGRPRAA